METRSVVIAFGGISPEHEVSVLTAMQLFAVLEKMPYDTVPLYISKTGRWYTGEVLREMERYQDLDTLLDEAAPCTLEQDEYGKSLLRELRTGIFRIPRSHRVDLMLISFHGADGENGSFQGLCEIHNLPYTGCDVLSSAIGMDKIVTKSLCRAHSIPVVEESHFNETEWVENRDLHIRNAETIGYPVVIKPVHLGSSIGVSIAENREELVTGVELAFRYDDRLLVEKAIQPLMEINCSVMGSPGNCRTTVCERPLGSDELLSFRDKYQSEPGESKGMASAAREIPAKISDELAKRIRQTSKEVFTLLGAGGVARLDFLVNAETGEYFFNEINTIPGSFSFYLWEATGLGFDELIDQLLGLAIDRHTQKNGRVRSYETNLLNQKAAEGIKGLKGIKQTAPDRS